MTFQEWERLHPEDPMGPVSDAAAYLFSEFDRLHILQSEFFVHDQHFITDHKLDARSGGETEVRSRAGQRAASSPAATPGDRERACSPPFCASGLHSDYLALIEKRYAAVLAGDEGRPRHGRAAAGRQPGFLRRLAGGRAWRITC